MVARELWHTVSSVLVMKRQDNEIAGLNRNSQHIPMSLLFLVPYNSVLREVYFVIVVAKRAEGQFAALNRLN